MANNKNPKPSTEDAMAAVSALIAKAKREGSIQSSELTAELETVGEPTTLPETTGKAGSTGRENRAYLRYF